MAEVQYDGSSGEPLRYPDPVQGDPNVKVTRQTGLPSWQQVNTDPAPVQGVIQGSPEIFTTRQKGSGTQHFDASGTLIADTRADDHSVLYVDVATMAAGDANPPGPGLARVAAPLVADPNQPVPPRPAFDAASSAPPAVPPVPPVAGVMPSDDGAYDPRDKSTGPQVITALPVVQKRAIVPVTTAPNSRVKKGKK